MLLLATQNNEPAEVIAREAEADFRIAVRRDLVIVRVLVRDAKGRAVPGLTQDAFQVFDNGKLQTITYFAVEEPASKAGLPP